ncbi:hypothetical protein D3C76_1463320 [compost metagenome]
MFVVRAQGQPGHIGAGLHHAFTPLCQQRRFTEPRAGNHQADAALLHVLQYFEQPAADNGLRADTGRRELS